MLFKKSEKALFRVLNLSGGIESTAMYLMAVEGVVGPKPEFAIFADTQWESKATYSQINWLDDRFGLDIPIRRVTAGSLKKHILAGAVDTTRKVSTAPFFVHGKNGKYATLRRWCTRDYKITAIRQEVGRLLREWQDGKNSYPAGAVEQWIGLARDEVVRIKDSGARYVEHRYPLIEAGYSQNDCVNWLRGRGYPVPPSSGCVGCPYHSDDEWRAMIAQRPDEFTEAVEFDAAIRGGFRGSKEFVYLHRSLRPLGEVDFTLRELPVLQAQLFQTNWSEECAGVCGI